MAQTSTLMNTLKRLLKRHGLTYRKVAQALDLSEASVKRLFSEESLSLSRLDQICQLMSMEFSELVREMESESYKISGLSEAQERELIADGRVLMVAFLVVNGWKLDEILEHYPLSRPEAIRCLVRLDKMKLIELLPGNRIKLLITPNFTWRRNGPIQHHFTAYFLEDFLRNGFERRNESLVFLSGMLSPTSQATMLSKMEKLIAEFNELHWEDLKLPLTQRVGYSMVLAMRPWRPSVIKQHLNWALGQDHVEGQPSDNVA